MRPAGRNKKEDEMIKILKRYCDESEWNETTEEEMIEHTEGSGFYKPGTALEILLCGLSVRGVAAEYKLENL